jgi:hypothetical protein
MAPKRTKAVVDATFLNLMVGDDTLSQNDSAHIEGRVKQGMVTARVQHRRA